jgi:acetyl esterase/lipase
MTISWLFLVVALWGAAFTALALWTPRRPAFLGPFTFFAAWLTSELAVWHLVWQAVAVVVFIALGALGAWPGWVALVVTLVSWSGLLYALTEASRTGEAFERALAETLGPNWRDAIAPEWARPRAGIEWRRMVSGWRATKRGIERTRNLPYAADGLKRHRLDVWRCADTGPSAPVLLQIHGGAWVTGSKDQQARPLMYHFAERGWVCVAINYRLSPKASWPDQLVDCKLALRWIRDHIAEFGGDPRYVVATGGSAGGHLTALVGLTANRPEYQPGFEQVDTTVRAMVPFYGVYDFLDRHGYRHAGDSFTKFAQKRIIKPLPGEEAAMFAQASPLDQVHRHAPPALVVHGDLDVLAPVEEARLFATRLREVSEQPVAYVELEGAQHAFDMFHSIRALHVVDEVDAFLSWLLSRDGKTAATGARGTA